MPVPAWLRLSFSNYSRDNNTTVFNNSNSSSKVLVGADARLLSATLWIDFQKVMTAADGNSVDLTALPADNLVDRVWSSRPSSSTAHKEVFVHELRWAGEPWQDKVGRLKRTLRDGAGGQRPLWGMLVTEYDEVAWLFNLRGRWRGPAASGGLQNTPVFESMALVTMTGMFLWLPDSAVANPLLAAHLAANDTIQLLNMSNSLEDLTQLLRTTARPPPGQCCGSGS